MKDLIRSITGEPTVALPNEFGGIITGNEGVYISPKTNITELPKILERLKKEYSKTTYKHRFDWIDNVKIERDPEIIENLKIKLIHELINNNSEAIHLAPPFIVDWESFGGIAFSPKGDMFHEFDIQNFYTLKEGNLSDLDWDKLMRQKLFFKDSKSEEFFSYYFWTLSH